MKRKWLTWFKGVIADQRIIIFEVIIRIVCKNQFKQLHTHRSTEGIKSWLYSRLILIENTVESSSAFAQITLNYVQERKWLQNGVSLPLENIRHRVFSWSEDWERLELSFHSPVTQIFFLHYSLLPKDSEKMHCCTKSKQELHFFFATSLRENWTCQKNTIIPFVLIRPTPLTTPRSTASEDPTAFSIMKVGGGGHVFARICWLQTRKTTFPKRNSAEKANKSSWRAVSNWIRIGTLDVFMDLFVHQIQKIRQNCLFGQIVFWSNCLLVKSAHFWLLDLSRWNFWTKL